MLSRIIYTANREISVNFKWKDDIIVNWNWLLDCSWFALRNSFVKLGFAEIVEVRENLEADSIVFEIDCLICSKKFF